MEHSFWHQKWESGQLGFHNSVTHPSLVKYLKELSLQANDRVFLPLCGKTLDIAYLLAHGHQIVGVELSQIAIIELFDQLNIVPTQTRSGNLTRFSANNIDMYVGDFFNLNKEILGKVHATYDRAALIALPKDMREEYGKHLVKITQSAPQLLICLEYDQALSNGPPFSVIDSEVHAHYANNYEVKSLKSEFIKGGLKGKFDAAENVWLLSNSSCL